MERSEQGKISKPPMEEGEDNDKDSENNKLVEPVFSDVIVDQPQSINQPLETGSILGTLEDENREKETNQKGKNRGNDNGETMWLCVEACFDCISECWLGLFFCCNEGCCDCDGCGCGECSDCSSCDCDCTS